MNILQLELHRLSTSIAGGADEIDLKVSKIDYDIESLIKVTCSVFDINIEDLKSKSQKRDLVIIRQILMWYFHRRLGLTQAKAGSIFGKEHATVVHACRVVDNRQHDYKVKPMYNLFIRSVLRELV